ncbi:MAG: DUF3148 domain-containing protein [Cyanobacteria bacterium J06597_16]
MSTSTFNVGDRVKIATVPPFLKSDESMPMLRPPDLVDLGEEGTVRSRKPGGYLGVRFSRGSFLIDPQYLVPASTDNS